MRVILILLLLTNLIEIRAIVIEVDQAPWKKCFTTELSRDKVFDWIFRLYKPSSASCKTVETNASLNSK